MWSRTDLKSRAWNGLKGYYWMAFAVSWIFGIAKGVTSTVTSVGGDISEMLSSLTERGGMDILRALTVMAAAGGIVFIMWIITLALKMFFVNPVSVGHNNFYLRAVNGESKFENIGCGFKNNYLNVVKSMFFVDLYTFLWSLLFVIPGIIKRYEYSMVPYILAENPNIDYNTALEISKKTTYGQKGEMFILDLSFIGWYLLGFCCCAIGTLFVNPYYYSTKAHLYQALKEIALRNGLASEADFVDYKIM